MNKKVIGVIIAIAIIILVIVISLNINKPLTKNEIKILKPANGDEVEIGDNYTISWDGLSNEEVITLVDKTYTSDNEFSYGTIVKDIPFYSKSYTWQVPLMQKQYNYKIAMWTKNRTEIAVSDGFFKVVDKNPSITGSELIKINPSNIFSFGTPFTLSGIAGLENQNPNFSFVYSSNQNVQVGMVTARLVSLYPDACNEGAFYPQDASNPKCVVNKGEQGVRIFVRAVIEDQGLFYVIGRNVYLSSETNKKSKFGDEGYQYEIELLSLDTQKQEAKIIIRKL